LTEVRVGTHGAAEILSRFGPELQSSGEHAQGAQGACPEWHGIKRFGSSNFNHRNFLQVPLHEQLVAEDAKSSVGLPPSKALLKPVPFGPVPILHQRAGAAVSVPIQTHSARRKQFFN
jgi:hypothetical protein